MSGISKARSAGFFEEIDGKVKRVLERPIECDWPNLWIDATTSDGGGSKRRPILAIPG